MGVSAAAPVPAAPVAARPALSLSARPALQLVQRSCDCGGQAGLSGKCVECSKNTLRPQRMSGGGAAEGEAAPPLVHQALAQPGSGLDPVVRKKFEAELGHDFSKVRIHDGPLADASARAVGANAYTVGHDIVFRAGLFRPGTAGGAQLLAHELTHTTQQAHAPRSGALRIGPANDVHERQARAAAAPRPAAAAPVPAAPAPAPARMAQRQVVQRDTPGAAPASSPGFLESLAGASADVLWGLVKKVAPGGVVDAIQAIRAKGIVGFLKDKLGGAFSGIFGGLGQGAAGPVAGLLGSFTQLLGAAKTILAALAHGDCKPLFDAVSKLGDTLGQMAGDAWDKLKAFLAPVGDFFSGLWAKFGAPAVDFITGAAADIWNGIKTFASQVWDLASSLVKPAWNWLKNALGIGDGAEGQNGLLQWVQQKLGEAWEAIKSVLAPVITPMKAFAAKIADVLPIDAILHLRERVHEWLGHAGSMVGNLQSPKGVTANQASLREKILPAVKAAIVSLGGQISSAGGWVAAQIGGLVQSATQLFASIKSNSILGAFSGAIDWVGSKVQALGDWVQNGVRGLFDTAGQAVAKLSSFVDPVLGVLQKLVSVIGNVVKALPGLVMGPVWALIPACIKDPIKDFIVQHILSEIPIISTFVKLPDIWAKIQKLVLDFLTAVFVNGDLSGAAIMVIRFVLEAAGVDVDLMLRVLGKAITTLDDIMMHPMKFLANIGGAIVAGFQLFWKNIGSNLFKGLQNWLLGPLAALGVTPMQDLSIGSIFKFVMQVLGLTMEKLRARLEKAIGAKAMGTITKIANVMADAWHWITTLWSKGPGAVWDEIKSRLADLGTAIMAGIGAWIGGDLIKIGIEKIAKLSNPAGAIIELIQTIYKTISFVVTKMNKILAMADAVLDSIGNIVKGNIGAAAGAIEKALVGAIGTVLAFLADWLGVSDPGEKLKGVVEKVQGKVEMAIDWLIAKAIALVQKIFGKDKKEDKSPKWTTAVAGVNAQLKAMEEASGDGKLTEAQIEKKLPEWKSTYGFNSLRVVPKDSNYDIFGAMSPEDLVAEAPAEFDGKDAAHAIDFAWIKPAASDYKEITLAPPEQVKPLRKGDSPAPWEHVKKLPGSFTLGPLGSKTLTTMPIGIATAYQIKDNFVFQAKSTTPRDPANVRKFNQELTNWGYNRNQNLAPSTDGDHVMELQVGGRDGSANLWPLNLSINRASGGFVERERGRILKQLNVTDLKDRYLRIKLKSGG
jgi:hypothetical protein